MKRVVFIASCLFISLYGFSQLVTVPVNQNTKGISGTLYTLPKTELILEVKTKITKEVPGKYFQYAERYLGLTDVCQSEKTVHEIEDVKLFQRAVADSKHSYYILNSKKGKEQNSIELTKDGFLASVNGNHYVETNNTETRPVTRSTSVPDYFSMEASIITKEMQQSTSVAKIAELAANELFNIRETRLNLLTQDVDKAPSDGRSYELVLSELNRMEKYYTELFTGKKTTTYDTKTFYLTPDENLQSVLFRFSQTNGIVDKSDLSGIPVNISITAINDLKIPEKAKQEEVSALYYRIPGKANVKLSDGNNKVYLEKVSVVAQFGKVLTLPSDNYSKINICPKTGAILRVEK